MRAPKKLAGRAIVLLSGGLDSTIALHMAMKRFDVAAAITFNYGQRHWVEIAQAAKIARGAKVFHIDEAIGSRGIGMKSQLTDTKAEIAVASDAVVPCRNLAMMTVAGSWLPRMSANIIVAGYSLEDANDFPDCRPRFVKAAASAISLSLDRQVSVWAPLINLSKADALREAKKLPGCWEALAKTWTCYSPKKVGLNVGHVRPCGICPSCTLRAAAFEAIGEVDPTAGKEIKA